MYLNSFGREVSLLLSEVRFSRFCHCSFMTWHMAEAAASLVGHLPIDSRNRNWQGAGALARPVFPVEKEKLCDVVESGEILGYITAQMAADSKVKEGLTVIATGSDKACEILGLGCVMKKRQR